MEHFCLVHCADRYSLFTFGYCSKTGALKRSNQSITCRSTFHKNPNGESHFIKAKVKASIWNFFNWLAVCRAAGTILLNIIIVQLGNSVSVGGILSDCFTIFFAHYNSGQCMSTLLRLQLLWYKWIKSMSRESVTLQSEKDFNAFKKHIIPLQRLSLRHTNTKA